MTEIQEVMTAAQVLPNEFVVNELRKATEKYMHSRTPENLKNVQSYAILLLAKHRAGDTVDSLLAACADFQRIKNIQDLYNPNKN